eukprot:maker-scaffold430_size173499-snap-gene-0.48 protein:Tk07002 transcript:maker-scaffold430_size173499-snap-gene-0.48-mRNA-1 annotation:"activated rna polymerase ii transcriptional coactivator p15"
MPRPAPPKSAKVASSSGSSDSDSGPEDRTPAKRKSAGAAAPAPAAAARAAPAQRPAGNPAVEGQEPTWDLGRMKKVKVREWRNQVFIDIREWYVDKSTMDEKPGKKGISLTAEQYQKFKTIIAEIDAALP